MEKTFKVLIIDDHPLIISSYEWALKKVMLKKNKKLEITSCTTISEASHYLNNINFFNDLDLLFLDIRLPHEDGDIYLSGEDIGMAIRDRYSNTTLIVSTTFNDNYRINTLLRNIDPEGFLVKNDLTPQELIEAITSVLESPPYYSKTVLRLIRKQFKNDYTIDNLDRELLYSLSLGTKTKDLPKVLPLSLAGIEKRKRNLKLILNVEKEGDQGLIEKAKAKGFI